MCKDVTVHAPLSREVFCADGTKFRDMQREMMQYASFLCIAQRVAGNGVNNNIKISGCRENKSFT